MNKQYITKQELKSFMKFVAVYFIICISLRISLNILEAKNKPISNDNIEKGKITQEEVETPLKTQINSKKEVSPIIKRYGYKTETAEVKKHKQDIVDYLWEKTKNIDMILTFEYESGLDENAIFNNIRIKDGIEYVKSTDYGLCMLNNQYHIAFIEDDNFNNWKDQADYCIRVYNDGIKRGIIQSTFYGYNHRLDRRGIYFINQEAYNEFYKLY